MSSFSDQVKAFSLKVEAQTQEVFVNVVSAVKNSITDGSPLTGSPGQPVDTGALKDSWQIEFDSPTSALISTDIVYAPSIEDGLSYAHGGSPMTLRSQEGGFHSVKLTIAGFSALVADEAKKVAGDG